MPTYRKNFISGVVFRIDFEREQIDFKEAIPEILKNDLLRVAPVFVINEIKNEELRIEALNNKIDRKTIEIKEHNYYANEKTKRISISKDYYFTEFSKYSSFADFSLYINPVIDYFKRNMPLLRVKRIGLRYINKIVFSEQEPTEWSRYINSQLICSLNFISNPYALCRSFTNNEYAYNGSNVKLKFGIINPDYPSIIRKNEFIIDIDVSKVGSFSGEDVEHALADFHNTQETFFETSITQGMRDYLNA